MSKGIVLVDIPDKCDGCEMCGTLIGKVICVATIKKINDINARPEWCPIRPMPEKSSVTPLSSTSFLEGWNAYIDAILKDGAK